MAKSTIRFPGLSVDQTTTLFVISRSSNPLAELDKQPKEFKDLITKKINECCLDALSQSQDANYLILSLANLCILEEIVRILKPRFGYANDIEDLSQHVFSEILKIERDGGLNFDPSQGASFKSYIKRIVVGTAADQIQRLKLGVSFPTAALRTAKQLRDKLTEFFGGEIPSPEEVVREYYQIDPEKEPKKFNKAVKSVRKTLEFFEKPISIYKTMLSGEGDELADFIEGNAIDPIDAVLYEELRNYIKVIKDEFGEQKTNAFIKKSLTNVNTEYTYVDAANDLGITPRQVKDLFKKINDRFKELIEGSIINKKK